MAAVLRANGFGTVADRAERLLHVAHTERLLLAALGAAL
jgi:hypothetical protein